DFPKKHPKIGKLLPSPEKLAEALMGRDCTRIQQAGAYAANILGLSEQVPAKVVFLTDGSSRMVKIGTTTIQLRRTTLKNMAMAGRLSGLLIQALHELGKENISAKRLEHLKRTIPLDAFHFQEINRGALSETRLFKIIFRRMTPLSTLSN